MTFLNRKFFAAAFILLLIRIVLGRFIGVWFWQIMYADDALFFRYADFYQHFIVQDLGFNHALFKDMGFPVFLNLVHLSGLHYTDCLALVWCLAAITSVILFKKLTGAENQKILLAIYAFILFSPIAFDVWCGTRLYRNAALTPFYFLTLNMLAILFVHHFYNFEITTKKFFLYQVIFGLIFTLTFYMKEDGIWLLACLSAVLVLCVIKIFIQKSISTRDKILKLVILFVPLMIYFGGTVFYKSINYKYFGVYEINIRTEGETGKFIKQIYKIKSENRNGRIWAPADALEKVFEASETLRSDENLKNLFFHSRWFGDDILKNPIHGDFLTWVTMSAMEEAENFNTYTEQEEFFKKVNAELDAAFANGTLEKDSKFQLVSSMGGRNFDEIISLLNPVFDEYLMYITMYQCRYVDRFESGDKNFLVMLASRLTHTKLYNPHNHPKAAYIIATTLFVIYGLIQTLLFIAAIIGLFKGIFGLLTGKINFGSKETLIIFILLSCLSLSFMYALAIAWFSEFLGFGVEMFKYGIGLVPMLMTFEIFGAYLFFKNCLSVESSYNYFKAIFAKLKICRADFFCLTTILFAGIILTFLTPPLQVPDEPNHFYRVYQISEGNFISPSTETADINGKKIYYYAEVPVSFENLFSAGVTEHGIIDGKNYFDRNCIKNLFSVPLNAESTEKKEIPNTGSYSHLVYAPQAVFAFLARIIFDSVGAVFYAARVGAVIFTVICVYLSIRILPEKKFLIFAVAFMPMFLFEMASCSADAVIYSVAILSTAYLFSLAKSSKKISAREIFLLALAAISLGLAKSVYGTILALYLLIPSERFGGRLKFYFGGIFLTVIFLISALGWMHFSKNGVDISPCMLPAPNVNWEEQVDFVKNNPLHFLKSTFYSLATPNFDRHFESFVGVLGWLTVRLPNVFYFLYSFVLMAGGVLGNLNLKKSQRALIILATLPTVLVTFLYLYVTWTPVGAAEVWGFQGRYLIPLAVMFLAAFSCTENKSFENKFIAVAGFISALVTVWNIFNYFY